MVLGKYFRPEKLDGFHSDNFLLNLTYEKIGKHFSNEVKGNTHRNKGVKKIISHCLSNYDYEPTGTEVKSILKNSYFYFGILEHYKIPYRLFVIFQSIIDLSVNIDEICDLCTTSIKNGGLVEPISSCDLLIPGVYNTIDNISEKRDSYNIFLWKLKQIIQLREDLFHYNKVECPLLKK